MKKEDIQGLLNILNDIDKMQIYILRIRIYLLEL